MKLILRTDDSNYGSFDGQEIAEIIRPLSKDEADLFDVGPMFEIRMANGEIIQAFADEIEQVSAKGLASRAISYLSDVSDCSVRVSEALQSLRYILKNEELCPYIADKQGLSANRLIWASMAEKDLAKSSLGESESVKIAIQAVRDIISMDKAA